MYALDFNLALGAGNTGLTLEAVIVDTTGTPVGAAITTGFTEIGVGNYLWHTAAMPDGHRGGVTFQVSPGGAIKAFASVNPQETENPDVKTSTRSSHAAADVWAVGTRTLTSFGTLVSDVATAVWAAGTRTLTSFGTLVADVATAVWAAGTRTLTSFGTLVADTTTAVWASGTRTLTSYGTLVADIWSYVTRTLTSGGGASAADVWAYATRTLTQSAAQVAAAVQGSDLVCLRGDTLVANLTGLGNITGRDKLWFTVKKSRSDADTAAILQIIEGTGLVRLNAGAATASDGSLTVTDQVAGNVTITLTATATAQLRVSKGLDYDLQWLDGAVVETLTEGDFETAADVTRSTS